MKERTGERVLSPDFHPTEQEVRRARKEGEKEIAELLEEAAQKIPRTDPEFITVQFTI